MCLGREENGLEKRTTIGWIADFLRMKLYLPIMDYLTLFVILIAMETATMMAGFVLLFMRKNGEHIFLLWNLSLSIMDTTMILPPKGFGTLKMNHKIGAYSLPFQAYNSRHDYTISAYLCSVARSYAPKLKIMLSREANPQICERSEFDYCSYDIWMAWVWRFTTDYTWMRQIVYGETSWFYSLDTDNNCAYAGTCNTALAPAVSNSGDNGSEDPKALNEGPHYRLIPWVAWALRISGWGYYHDDIFWDTRAESPTPSRPRISAALIREGLEDYEYLYQANGNARAVPYEKVDVDDTVLSLGFAVGVWLNDPNAIHTIRHELGLYIEGSRDDYPYLVMSPGICYVKFFSFTFRPPIW